MGWRAAPASGKEPRCKLPWSSPSGIKGTDTHVLRECVHGNGRARGRARGRRLDLDGVRYAVGSEPLRRREIQDGDRAGSRGAEALRRSARPHEERRLRGRGQEILPDRQAADEDRVGPQGAHHVGLRQLRGQGLGRGHQRLEALHPALSLDQRHGLRLLPAGHVALQPDPGRHATRSAPRRRSPPCRSW